MLRLTVSTNFFCVFLHIFVSSAFGEVRDLAAQLFRFKLLPIAEVKEGQAQMRSVLF